MYVCIYATAVCGQKINMKKLLDADGHDLFAHMDAQIDLY
jgi:hypothetical protein